MGSVGAASEREVRLHRVSERDGTLSLPDTEYRDVPQLSLEFLGYF